jgi:hypothetical protein
VQYVEKKFMEVDYNMLVQNHFLLQYVVQKISPYGVVVQWLRTWFFNVEMRNLNPHTCNLSYLGYLGDLIR